jgi:hypothetical protein
MKIESRCIRVFLSSTFHDFAEERDLLVKQIFPELRRKCLDRQVELLDVDLRWGITEEEAQQGKVLPICLTEIDRSSLCKLQASARICWWVLKIYPEHSVNGFRLLRRRPSGRENSQIDGCRGSATGFFRSLSS